MPSADTAPLHGLTPREVGKLLRIGPDRVRAMILRGELGAVNTAPTLCGKPRFIVLPHHLREFEQRRAAATPATPRRRRGKEPAHREWY